MEKKKIVLEFKVSDFKENGYTVCDTCAITTALKRAGIDAFDGGIMILDSKCRELTNFNSECYKSLVEKVVGIYSFVDDEEFYCSNRVFEKITPHDFTHELEINVF